MSTKSRQTIFGGSIMGAKIRAEGARKRAAEAIREADRAEAEAWSVQMEGYGGPAQPSPTIGQCINGGLDWLEVECKRCKTRASLPLDAIRRPRNTPIWKLEATLKCRSCRTPRYSPPASHDQAHRGTGAYALRLGASGRGSVRATLSECQNVEFAGKTCDAKSACRYTHGGHQRIRGMPLTASKRPSTAAGMPGSRTRSGYIPPVNRHEYPFADLLVRIGRGALEDRQMDFLRDASSRREPALFYSGELDVLDAPSISIVGTREVTENGWKRASKLARQLVDLRVTIVSGLAKGVDTAALSTAIDSGGRVAAVIGTPLDKAYPAENAGLQQAIYSKHLLMSPFREGERVFRSNFPVRNRVMAAISDGTVIIEASDTSGTLHQAAECLRLGRWLFIAKSVLDDPTLTWPARFLTDKKTVVLESVSDIMDRISK
jgi:DNA protecting protein DprA